MNNLYILQWNEKNCIVMVNETIYIMRIEYLIELEELNKDFNVYNITMHM